jgi:hypothetical protein
VITDLGSLTLAVIAPGAAVAAAAAVTVSGLAAPEVQAQLDALADFSPSAQLSFLDQIAQCEAIITGLQAMIAAGITPPSLSAQVTITLNIVASLQVSLAAIQAQLDIAVGIQDLLAEGSVRLFTYSGPQDDFGGELAAELGAPTTSVNALVLLTSNGASWTAMQGLFKTS